MSLLRVAVLGTGNRAQAHLLTLSRLGAHLCELVGLCDSDPGRLAQAVARWSAPGFADLEEMLVAARPQLLYVIVPPDGHRAATELAARHGVHAISETPIAPTLALADAMLEAARRHAVTLEIAENVWRWPDERLKQKIVASGLIGRVTQVHLWYMSGAYHGMNAVRTLIGARALRARGYERETPVAPYAGHQGFPIDTHRYELGIVEFEGDAVCVYQFPHSRYRGNSWEVVGTDGAIVGNELVLFRGSQRESYPIRREVDTSVEPAALVRVYVETDPPVVWENPLRQYPVGAAPDEIARADVLADTRRAILEGGEPGYGAASARADQEVVIAVRESALRDGAWVALPLDGETEVERRLHEEYRSRYGHDPLAPAEVAIRTFYPRPGSGRAPAAARP
jgi:predicted dehydrogenase